MQRPDASGTADDGSIVVPIRQPSKPADVASVCREVCSRLEATDAERLVCDVGAIDEPDVMTIDALARIQLTARRLGRIGLVAGAGPALTRLLELAGLDDVLPRADSGVEVRRKPEEREELLGVQEERDPADPPA